MCIHRLNSFRHKQQRTHLVARYTIFSLYLPFFSYLISIKPSCFHLASKSLQALDSCESQTNDLICVSPSTLLFWARQAPELFFLCSPLLSHILPATPDPTGLSCSCFTAHSCWSVTERIGHILRVAIAQGLMGKRSSVMYVSLGTQMQAHPFCGEIFFWGHGVDEMPF